MRSTAKTAAFLLVFAGAAWGLSVQDVQAAVAQQVQSGTAVNSANGIQTVTISGVDPTKSFLIFSTRSNSNRPVGSTVRGRIPTACANPCTTIEFERVTDGIAPEPAPINIQWYVVTFGSGVKVQRGEVAQSATTVNVAITAVASLSQAFVLWSKTPIAADNTWDNNDAILGELTTTTNLQFRTNGANAGHTIAWQVVEFTNAADINVQKGSITTMIGTATSVTATLSPAVNVNKTFVLIGWQTSGTGPDIGSRMLRAQLTNSTTITIDRSISGTPDDITEIVWQAIELKDNSFVWSGTSNFAAGASQATATLSPVVNTTRAVAFGSGQSGAGQNMGRSPYAGDDIIGVGAVTASLGTAFRAAAQAGAGSGVLTLTITKPAGTAEGDVMVASIGVRPNTAVITVPSASWTLVRRTDNATGGGSLATYWKVAGASEPASYNWTFNTSTGSAGGILSFTGVDSANPVDVEFGQNTPLGLTHDAPSVTTTGANEMIVTAHSFMSAATWTRPTGMTEAVDVASAVVPLSAAQSTEINYALQTAAGATGIKTATASNDADDGNTQTLALRVSKSAPYPYLTLTRDNTLDTADVGWFVVEFDRGDAQIVSGVYTGNGVDNRAISGLGFVPDFVIVKATSQNGVFRTSTMSGDNAKQAVANVALTANWVQSLDSAGGGGFTVGTDAKVNSAGVLYYWTAFKAGAGKMQLGTYLGTGLAGNAVTGLGFSPEAVFVMAETALAPAFRTASTTNSFLFNIDNGNANRITSLDADGFTLGTNANANTAGVTYHYIAWNKVADYMDVGSYTGTGAARNINGVGFPPELVIVKSTNALGQLAVQHPASLGAAVDSTLYFDNTANSVGRITSLQTTSPPDDGFSVGTNIEVNGSGDLVLYIAWKRASTPLIVTGTYTGNGVDNTTITSLGFTPDVVIVKGNTTQNAVIRTSTMVGDNAKPMVGATALTADLIQSLDGAIGGGFTIGTNAMVNSNTLTYHFIAFKAGAGAMKVGTYTGTGASNAITGVGFSPELVFIMSAGAAEAVHRSSASTEAYNFANSAGDTTLITSLDSDGFTVATTNASVNASGTTYHYIAWNEIPGQMKVGSYSGNGIDNRNVTGVGFEPEYIIARNLDAQLTVHHTGSLGRSTDESLFFNNTADAADVIQALEPDGFQVGTAATVNTSSGTPNYWYYAWKRPYVQELTAVRLTAFTATRYARGVLVQWRTGYEIDNLGFNVYREIDGSRTRVNRSLVAGSGLMAGRGTAVTAEQRYAIWDLDPIATSAAVVYWLEDVDFNGKSTWHGPITPMAGGLNIPDVAASTSIESLGTAPKRGRKIFFADGSAFEAGGPGGRRASAPPEVESQWALAAANTIKIGINKPGWYRVGQPDLVAAGLNPRVDPGTLRLFLEGVEHAIVVTRQADGRFDPGDAIEFYAAGADTPYTNTRVYWLAAGSRKGQRIPLRGGRAVGPEVGQSFWFTTQRKDRSIYFAALRNGDAENWFGPLVWEEPTDLTLTVSHLDPAAPGPAQLEVVLQGVTDTPEVNPDHHVGVRVNGVEVGEMTFDGQDPGVQTFAVASEVLREGENTVTLIARGGEEDYSLANVLRLSYWHAYRADADLLRFTAEGQRQATIGGFAGGPIRVVDITDPAAAVEVRGGVQSEGGGFSSIAIRVPGAGTRLLLAFTGPTVGSPAYVRANQPSTWHKSEHANDYVVVAHQNFIDQVQPLAALRAQQGHRSAVVDIDDVYDEFSFGEKTPQALKDFLTWAKTNWQHRPEFLMLVGDATMDPRDYAGMGDADFVPTKQIPMASVALETASDDWFADADDDGLPELAVGRLPVRTVEQATALVSKIVGYDTEAGDSWTKNVALVADEDDQTTGFAATSAHLKARLPKGYTGHELYSGVLGAASVRSQLFNLVNQGQLIVNYVGHGSVQIWGRSGDLLTNEDVPASWTTDGYRLPFVVAMNCLNGFFHGIYGEDSLAEALMRAPKGGAVAVWASSSVTPSEPQSLVNEELFLLIFQGAYATVGEAVAAAKRVVSDRDLRRSWIFFGDPAMRLNGVPQPSTARTAAVATSTPSSGSSSAASRTRGSQGQDATIDSRATTEREGSFVRLADYNGDGRDDIFLYAAETGRWSIVLSGSDGTTSSAGYWPPHMALFAATLNGDRRADLLLHNAETGEWLPALNTGAGRFRLGASAWAPRGRAHVADFNGDGRDDLFVVDGNTGLWTECLTATVEAGLQTRLKDLTCHAGDALASGSWLVSDFTGDGLADVLTYDPATGHWTLGVNNGAGAFRYVSGDWSPGWTVRAANLDGDRRRDVVLLNPASGAWVEAFSIGAGEFTYRRGQGPVLSGVEGPAGGEVYVLDVDGDGRDDLLRYNSLTGAWTIGLNVAPGAFTYSSGVWAPGLTLAWGDVNGDGRADLLLHDPATGRWGSLVSRRPSGVTAQSGTWSVGWAIEGWRP